jgi:hypothetical protein
MENHGVSAADDPKLIRKWLQDCRSTHQWCRKPNRKLPTRVIDVEPWPGSHYLRLVSSKGCDGDYAALSHCWGTSPVNKTTKAREASYRRGIRFASLGKTFQDAIKVTRNLGLRYLWIDALCIIQDDKDDWRREAETMADVYANASVTLAATASADGAGGLFHPRQQPKSDLALKWTRAGNTTPERIHWRVKRGPHTLFLVEILKAPLNQRGWVIQERTLSTRIIHFARDQLFWECQESTLSETNVRCEDTSSVSVKPATLLAQGSLTKHAWVQHKMDMVWKEIIARYTDCQLTYQGDKLVAVAGIAKAWARACGDRYVAGLWQRTLPFALFWVRAGESQAARLPFPTWSWTSTSSSVWFQEHNQLIDGDLEIKLSDIEVCVNGSFTESFFTQIQEGTLFLTGHIKYTIFEWCETTIAKYYRMILSGMNQHGEGSAVHQHIVFDVKPPPVLNKPVPTLLLFRVKGGGTSTPHYKDHFMVLEPQQDPDHYQRIGIGQICVSWSSESTSTAEAHDSSWFHDADRVKIRIS